VKIKFDIHISFFISIFLSYLVASGSQKLLSPNQEYEIKANLGSKILGKMGFISTTLATLGDVEIFSIHGNGTHPDEIPRVDGVLENAPRLRGIAKFLKTIAQKWKSWVTDVKDKFMDDSDD